MLVFCEYPSTLHVARKKILQILSAKKEKWSMSQQFKLEVHEISEIIRKHAPRTSEFNVITYRRLQAMHLVHSYLLIHTLMQCHSSKYTSSSSII